MFWRLTILIIIFVFYVLHLTDFGTYCVKCVVDQMNCPTNTVCLCSLVPNCYPFAILAVNILGLLYIIFESVSIAYKIFKRLRK